MFRTFNMGIGMTVIVSPKSEKKALAILKKCGYIKDSRKRIPVMVSKSGFVGNIDEKIVKIDLDTIERVVKKYIGIH